jgi:hypothetical protein
MGKGFLIPFKVLWAETQYFFYDIKKLFLFLGPRGKYVFD